MGFFKNLIKNPLKTIVGGISDIPIVGDVAQFAAPIAGGVIGGPFGSVLGNLFGNDGSAVPNSPTGATGGFVAGNASSGSTSGSTSSSSGIKVLGYELGFNVPTAVMAGLVYYFFIRRRSKII